MSFLEKYFELVVPDGQFRFIKNLNLLGLGLSPIFW